MSYANWNPTQFYLIGDIVNRNGTDYQATANNYDDAPPSASWSVYAGGGVASVTAGTAISITGTATNPIVNNTAPATLSKAFQVIQIGAVPAAGNNPVLTTAVLDILAIQYTPSLFNTSLTTGTPSGYWKVDLSGLTFTLLTDVPTPTDTNRIYVEFVDNVTAGGPYLYSPVDRQVLTQRNDPPNNSTIAVPLNLNLGSFIIDVAAARATGLRSIDVIRITNDTSGTLQFNAMTDVYAEYYPNGVQ